MNRGRNQRRRKRKITGRFYGFLCVILVLVVMVSVFISTRNRQANPASNDQQASANPTMGSDEEWGLDSGGGQGADETLEPLTADNTITVDDSDLAINTALPSEWWNILLLGSDARDVTKRSNTDTIMIASINTNDGRIKLTSIMRDSMIFVEERNAYVKINSLAYFGGPKLTIKAINQNLNMNIRHYVLVNFLSLQKIIDIMGGVVLDISTEEMDQINHNMKEQARMDGLTFEEWTNGGYKLETYGSGTKLTGMQAVAFARIRHVGNGDFDRTNRQQRVMEALFKKVKDGGVNAGNMLSVALELMKHVDTNLNITDIASVGGTVLIKGIGKFDTSGRIPMKDSYVNTTRGGTSALYDINYDMNTSRLYNYIYIE